MAKVTVPALRVENVTKVYGSGAAQVRALDGVDLEVERASFTAIMGPSGSGKSTLLHCMAGLDTPTSGHVFVENDEVSAMNDEQLTQLRRTRIGFVFQANNLLPTLTARENILLPMTIAGTSVDPAWLDEIVDAVGLGDRLTHRPGELSQGQCQRVAIARALITRPALVLADEPTGNLDSKSGAELLDFLHATMTTFDQTIVMVTHDLAVANSAERIIFIADGKVVDASDVESVRLGTIPTGG